MQVFVTYDVEQDPDHSDAPVLKGVKRVDLRGRLLRWEVGEYPSPTGKHLYGVRIFYLRDPRNETEALATHERGRRPKPASLIVEVPADAENVRLQTQLPEEYAHGFEEAA